MLPGKKIAKNIAVTKEVRHHGMESSDIGQVTLRIKCITL